RDSGFRPRQELQRLDSGHGHCPGKLPEPADHRGALAQDRRESMNFKFRNKRISGVLAVVPANERSFVDEMKNYNFPEARSLKLKEVMGYDTHRMVPPDVCVSDLGVFALKNLFDRGLLRPEEIDALILVTQTPDYFMPPTSNVI